MTSLSNFLGVGQTAVVQTKLVELQTLKCWRIVQTAHRIVAEAVFRCCNVVGDTQHQRLGWFHCLAGVLCRPPCLQFVCPVKREQITTRLWRLMLH